MEKEIEEITENIDCKNDFKCYYEGIENFSKVKCDYYSSICEAITQDGEFCEYSQNFGYNNICICPLLKHLIEKRNNNFLKNR